MNYSLIESLLCRLSAVGFIPVCRRKDYKAKHPSRFARRKFYA